MAGVIAAAVAVGLCGCRGEKLSSKQFEGTWRATSSSLATLPGAPAKSILVLRAEGSCSVENLPDAAYYDGLAKGESVSGTGVWELKVVGGEEVVSCDFMIKEVKIAPGVNFKIRRSSLGLVLSFSFGGDPEHGGDVEYVKTE